MSKLDYRFSEIQISARVVLESLLAIENGKWLTGFSMLGQQFACKWVGKCIVLIIIGMQRADFWLPLMSICVYICIYIYIYIYIHTYTCKSERMRFKFRATCIALHAVFLLLSFQNQQIDRYSRKQIAKQACNWSLSANSFLLHPQT